MSTKQTIVRNYQGAVPAGSWACAGCVFETASLDAATVHSDSVLHWLWLFEPGKKEASFEVHPSDLDGVYLNTWSGSPVTINDVLNSRVASAKQHLRGAP
jgi:hypothetical protein